MQKIIAKNGPSKFHKRFPFRWMNSTSENLDLENDLPAYDFSETYCNLQARYHRFLETEKKTTSRQSPSKNDLCQSASCGTNAVCEAKENEALCKCPNGYSGDGKTGCRPDKICYNRSCGTNAICEEIDHRLNCKCPQGYVGNPLLKCQEGTEESDSDKLREALIEAKCPENKNLPLGRSHSR